MSSAIALFANYCFRRFVFLGALVVSGRSCVVLQIAVLDPVKKKETPGWAEQQAISTIGEGAETG